MTKNMKSLETLSLKEIVEFQERLDRAREAATTRTKSETREKIEALLEAVGMTLQEIFGKSAPRGKYIKKLMPAKYQHPNNKGLGWSGKGQTPRWMKELLDKGMTKEEMLIKHRK